MQPIKIAVRIKPSANAGFEFEDASQPLPPYSNEGTPEQLSPLCNEGNMYQ
jgi:hypothetical protein